MNPLYASPSIQRLLPSLLFLGLAALVPLLHAADEEILLETFEDAKAVPFRPNEDGGTPPAMKCSAEQPHTGKGCLQLNYQNTAKGWGNVRMPAAISGAEERIGLWIKKVAAAKGAALHVWLFEEDGDGWLSPSIKLDELAAGWQRMEVALKDFHFEPRGNKVQALTETDRLMLGCNFADFTVLIDDLYVAGPDLIAKRKAALGEGSSVNIAIDPQAVVCERFMGFGAEWDPKFWTNGSFDLKGDFKGTPAVTEEDWTTVLKRVRFMKLPVARVMMLCKWCTEGDGKFDFETNHMKSLYRHLDACQKEGITVILTDWGCSTWTKVPGFSGVGDPKYAEAIGTYLEHLVTKKGYTCIRYFVLVNEPNLEAGGYEPWKKGVEQVSKILADRKLDKQVTFMGSDQTNADDWHYRAVDQLQQLLGAYDFHRYSNQADVKAGRVETYAASLWQYALAKDPHAKTKPLVIGEAGLIDNGATSSQCPDGFKYEYGVNMADYAVQCARAGSWSVLAWMLDDNSHAGFTWGMWKNKAGGLALKPWFYPWSLLCRTVRPGATIYRLPAASKRVRVLAAKLPGEKPDAAGWTFVLVNRRDAEVSAKLRVPKGGAVSLWRYAYTPASAPADADGFPKPEGEVKGDLEAGIDVAVPGNAVLFLTTVAP